MRKFFRLVSKVLPSEIILKGFGNKTIFPFYHLVSDKPPQHVKNLYQVLSEKEFERDLDYFLKYYTPIDAKTLIDHLDNEIVLSKPASFLSFDDGFREVKEVISPILLRKGIPAALFVNPAYIGNIDLMYRCKISLIIDRIETSSISNAILAAIAFLLNTQNDILKIKGKIIQLKHNQNEVVTKIARMVEINFSDYLLKNKPYLSLEDLKTLEKSGFSIGGHGYNHPYFNEISFNEQVMEVKQCMHWIETNFPRQPKLFAFPFTDYGVSDELLQQMVLGNNKLCDVSFGTAGVQPIKFKRHIQRIPMENNGNSGISLVDSEIIYYLAKKSLRLYKKEA